MKISSTARVLAAASGLTLALLMSGNASALTAGVITTVEDNQGVVPVYGTDSRAGYYGASWYLSAGPGGADIKIEYLGAESGFNNEFHWYGDLLKKETDANSWPTPEDLGTYATSAGLLDFFFSGDLGDAVNGANADDADGTAGPNFFSTLVNPGPTALAGTVLDLWFDDSGANDDDNHDDMAIRLSIVGDGSFQVVPIPAAAWLFGSALMGMVGIGYRRTRKA
jgi:hypothetical protein